MPRTLELAVLAIVLSVIFSVPLGVISTVKPDSWLDFGARTFTIVGIAIPNFLMAILMIISLLTIFNWLPPLGYVELWDNPIKNMQQMIFPAIALAIYDMAFIARVTRSSMMEYYVKTTCAPPEPKGLASALCRSDPGLNTHHFLPMRYGVSMLQVARVHPEPVEGFHRASTVDSKRVVRRAHHDRI
jgi:peptide/nickel transport system permease protein